MKNKIKMGIEGTPRKVSNKSLIKSIISISDYQSLSPKSIIIILYVVKDDEIFFSPLSEERWQVVIHMGCEMVE